MILNCPEKTLSQRQHSLTSLELTIITLERDVTTNRLLENIELWVKGDRLSGMVNDRISIIFLKVFKFMDFSPSTNYMDFIVTLAKVRELELLVDQILFYNAIGF